MTDSLGRRALPIIKSPAIQFLQLACCAHPFLKMKTPRLHRAIAALALLLFANLSHADVNVLIVGSGRDTAADYYAISGDSQPFLATKIRDELESILLGANVGNVNVTLLDRSAEGLSTQVYSLFQWFYSPLPADIETTTRWPYLRGESYQNINEAPFYTSGATGTDWDHVILIGDPYTMEKTPGLYAHGVEAVGQEVTKGGGKVTLLMPWPATGSSSSVDHYKEVVYRAGRSGGYQVAPAGLAWQADGSQTAVTPDSDRGAYLCAASIYSRIWEESASNSTHSYDDTLADAVHTTVTSNMGATQYSGSKMDFQNSFLMLGDPRRNIYNTQKGTSTEGGYGGGVARAMTRSRVNFDDTIRAYSDNMPTAAIWSTLDLPIAFNHGRNGDSRGYVVNPDFWQLAFGFGYQATSSNDGEINRMLNYDLYLAHTMLTEGDSVRCIPWRLMWAEISRRHPTLEHRPDGEHVRNEINTAVGNYMYTLYSGRCPIDPIPEGQTESDMGADWFAQKVGYETAWRLGRVSSHAPGFKVMPSAATALTVTPSTTETMTVQFIFPPKNDVTVNISSSDNSAGMVGPQKLVFTPENYNVPQNVTVTGVAGSSASAPFDVVYSTSSDDPAYDGLSDSWAYTNVLTATPLTHVDNGEAQYSTPSDVAATINLNASGADAANTTFAGPNHGTLSWSGDDVVYTPDASYLGTDGFAYASLNGSIVTTGHIDIDVIAGYAVGSVRAEVADSSAAEEGQATGTFTITREGDTSSSLDVNFTISGTATIVDDYNLSLSSPVTIPAGQSSVDITLTPMDDTLGEQTETASIAVVSGAGYTEISNPATISIADNDNTSPTVIAGVNQSTDLDLFGANDPGLYYGEVSSIALDILTPNPETLQITNVAAYTEDSIDLHTTEIYTGQIYDADGAISFSEDIDDSARIWIDGVLVVTSDTYQGGRISSANLNLTPGWHDIEIRIANSSQNGGPVSLPGIGYDPAGGTAWQPLVDPGDGSLLRVGTVPSVTVSLNGTVTDPDDTPAKTWTLFSSDPAGQSVTFANPSSLVTTATFSAAGTYVLHLTADDGYGPVFDEVVITVAPPTTYTLTVTGGTGDGDYPAGVTASINADVPVGYRFINWTTSDGGSLADENSPSTAYTMPANAVEVTANYVLNNLPVVNVGSDQTLPFLRNTPWTPAMIDTVAWFDASDSSSIAESGGLVSQWNDKSGNANHATQSTETSRPIYDSTSKSITGGLVRELSLPTDMYLGKTSGSLCFVGKQTGSGSGWGILSGYNGRVTQSPWTNGYHKESFLNGEHITATTQTSGLYLKQTLQSRVHTGTNMQMYSDGNNVLDSASSFDASTPYAKLFGERDDYILYEVIFLPDADVSNRQKAEGYLAHKWGLALPAGHPYENAAPIGPGASPSLAGVSATDTDTDDTLTTTWSVVSKVPSDAADPVFDDASLVNPTITFLESGTYTLRLTANDGWSSVSHDVVITVEEEVNYTLTVTGGTGDGGHLAYTSATITADAPAAGYRFANWTTSDGGSFADVNALSTTYTMPANAAEVTANYELNSLPVVNAGPDQSLPSTFDTWTPDLIATVAWFDASDTSTITESGGAVSQWDDKSGNENHATQPSSGSQPSYDSTSNSITGSFSKKMSLPTDMYLGKTSGSLCFVGKQIGPGAGWGKVSSAGSDTLSPLSFGSVDYFYDSFLSGGLLNSTATSGMNQVQTLQSRVHTGTTMEMYSDGVNIMDSASTLDASTLYAQLFGQRIADYTLYEVVFLPDADVSNRQRVEGYLAHKWGTTLPAGHPYENAAPLADAVSHLLAGASVTDADSNDTLTTTWSVVNKVPSDAADPTFDDSSLVNPTAFFTESGTYTYTLRLTANDGWASVSDDVVITNTPLPTYALTVTGGTGDGDYVSGASATITADAPAADYRFANWTTSDGGSFADVNASSTTYSMPAGAAEVTANYELNNLPVVNAGADQALTMPAMVLWTPAQVATVAWFDASDNSTITESGGLVSQWHDKSGNGNHATQPSSGSQPAYDSTINRITGGSAKKMSLPTDMYLGKTSGSLCFVGEQVGSGAGWGKVGSSGLKTHSPWTDGRLYDCFLTGGRLSSVATSGLPGTQTLQSRVHTGANMEMYSDGVEVQNAGSTFDASTSSAELFGQHADYTLYEVVFLPDADASNRQKLEGYLAHKWGTALPAGHPYENAAPVSSAVSVSLADASVTDADSTDTLTASWSVVSKTPSDAADPIFGDTSLVNTTATFIEAGTYTLRLTADDGVASVSDDVVITVSAIPAEYAAWSSGGGFAHAFTDTDTAPNANPDGDGSSNLMEFAFGTDPTLNDANVVTSDGSTHGKPMMKEGTTAGSYEFFFVRRKDHGTTGSVSYTPQFSTDLGTFTDNNDVTNPPIWVADSTTDANYEVVKVPYPTGTKFGRIKIDAAP